jgi:hypothetical protein
MNKGYINNLASYIFKLKRDLDVNISQLRFLKQEDYDEEEIIELEDLIADIERELDLSLHELNWLEDKSVIHDVDDIRNLMFGYYKKKGYTLHGVLYVSVYFIFIIWSSPHGMCILSFKSGIDDIT